MYYNDPSFLLIIPALILAFYAQFKVQATYAKYSQVVASSGISAAQLSRKLLDQGSLLDVSIEETPGNLTDHYDPRSKTLRLSEGIYNSQSVAALGIAAHEVGHAIQDVKKYAPLGIRNNLVPAANFGTTLAFPLFFMGIIFSTSMLMDIGIALFSVAVVFQVITLPVEFNASNRAILLLKNNHILNESELKMVKQVLSAAALTYIAATAMSVLNLLRLLMLRSRRD